MTSHTVIQMCRNRGPVGERVELGRYTVSGSGERVLWGQRISGVVRITDCPADSRGRAYLVERGLEKDGPHAYAALKALVADYLDQCLRLDAIPMAESPLGRYLDHLTP